VGAVGNFLFRHPFFNPKGKPALAKLVWSRKQGYAIVILRIEDTGMLQSLFLKEMFSLHCPIQIKFATPFVLRLLVSPVNKPVMRFTVLVPRRTCSELVYLVLLAFSFVQPQQWP
jgi:hypothetical protein